jgi:hypothetical protein
LRVGGARAERKRDQARRRGWCSPFLHRLHAVGSRLFRPSGR